MRQNLRLEDLREPPSWHWPGYFWMLNDRLDEDTIIAQLEDMARSGARSVCPHPMPHEFRPDAMNTRLDPPYLSEDYFRFFRLIVGHCRRLGMHCWLYDEGGWPSGSAAGRVCASDPPRLACQSVSACTVTLSRGQNYTVGGDDVCAEIRGPEDRRVLRPGETAAADEDGLHLRVVRRRKHTVANTGGEAYRPQSAEYASILHPETTRRFLALTHEQYAAHVGEEFGTTIRFVFTDEPAVMNRPPHTLPWTDDLATEFLARKGYALHDMLPALFVPPGDNDDAVAVRARVDFSDVWSQLLVERYLKPIRAWCRRHGLLSSGHFGGEDRPENNAAHGFGHILRTLRGLDLPGVDAIWRQIWPGRQNDPFPRYAASVAAQQGQPLVMSESFAVYGSGLTIGQMKWIAEYRFVRGVNLLIASNYPYAPRDHFMSGCRPHFGPHNPLWKHMDAFHARMARLSYLLSRGALDTGAAVYYDVRGIWAGGPHAETAARRHLLTARALDRAQCAYSFIDDDILTGREGRVEGGRLIAGVRAARADGTGRAMDADTAAQIPRRGT